jgi:hypothetical protein
MKLNHEKAKSWKDYMITDIKALVDCDAIFLLVNWTESKGAIVEFYIANNLGLKTFHENLNDY